MRIYIFFLIALLGAFSIHQVYATHYNSVGYNDVFVWREHDVDPVHSVWCTFDGIKEAPFDAKRISLGCEHGVFNGTERAGALYLTKVFNVDDIYNGTSNVFSWRFNNTSTSGTPTSVGMSIMDGYYDYQSTSQPGGFPNDIDWVQAGGTPTCAGGSTNDWYLGTPFGPAYCFKIATGEAANIIGTGYLDDSANGKVFMPTTSNSNGEQTISLTIDNTEWTFVTQSQITVFLGLIVDDGAVTEHFMQPLELKITNTDFGTMTWNFPETEAEADLWALYGGEGAYELNGTNTDYGYFFSYDPSVPDPPTNLYAVEFTTSIDLNWDAPSFDGYDPVSGYKIERESPVGGGWSVLVANTGNTLTSYTDSTITIGQEYNYRVRALNIHGESLPSNESKDGTAPTTGNEPIVSCDGLPTVFSLFVPIIGVNDAVLCWNGSILNQTALLGYQINYTTPWGDPQTIGVNDTGNQLTQKTLTPLSANTQYSVRVQSWMNGSMNNVTNIANFTTRGDLLEIGNLTIPSQSNPLRFDWIFTRDDLSPTDVAVMIEYPTSFNATCTFNMKFARQDISYSNISTTPHPTLSDRQIANFTFTDYNNELITATCVDENTNSTGKYIIYQTDYPLLQQIGSFRDGTYGTMGQFAFFDFFTLGAMFFAMIGFNRVHPGVGAIFAMMILGVASYLGFINNIFTTATIGIIMTVVILAVLVHHRNDVLN